MKALVHLREQDLADRRAKGLDRWDEMWEGVLHMPPAPNREHQRIPARLIAFLEPRIRMSGRGTLEAGINVFRDLGPIDDYRIPDLTFVAAGREHVLQDDGVRGEGPDAVIEICSPDDETYEKLPFFAALGVKEVIVCQRDSKEVEIFRLAGSQYVALQRDGGGWLASTRMGIRMAVVQRQRSRCRGLRPSALRERRRGADPDDASGCTAANSAAAVPRAWFKQKRAPE